MQRRIGLTLVSLSILLLSGLSVAGTSERAKPNKKHVKATLTDAPATATPPAGTPPAPPAPPAPTAAATPPAPPRATATGVPTSAPATSAGLETSKNPPGATGPATRPPAVDATPRDVPSFQERVDVTEVQLDAVVEDGGKQVTGLGPEDFEVTEDGRPVEITSVRFYGAAEQLEASGEGEVARADRFFILLFHDRSRDASFVRPLLLDAGRQARKWVEEERLPNDQVAVMAHDVRLEIFTDFTRDRDQILDAISLAVTSKPEPDRGAGRSQEPPRPMVDSPSLLSNLPAPSDLARESRVFEKALALIGRAAGGIVGRKNMILFSVGFGELDPSGIWVPDVRYYPTLEKDLNDGNVAVYTIDLLGARRGGPAGLGVASSLAAIAGDTAGLYYESFTNFMTPMKEVAKDTAGYYLLSYRSEYPRGTSGYREVKVDTKKKGYEVRARKGYRFGAEGSDDDPHSSRQ